MKKQFNYYIQDKAKEVDEDVIITLTARNPQAPKNLIKFHGIKKEFVTIKLVESMIDHLNIESTILHRNTEEAKKQREIEVRSRFINLCYLFPCTTLKCSTFVLKYCTNFILKVQNKSEA